MKKQFLLAFGLASMLLAGCSDSDNVADGGNTPDPNATGYLSVRVALPSTSGYAGRAESDFTNDKYDQGKSDEYKVQTIDLVCLNSTGLVVKNITIDPADIGWSTAPGSANGITTEKVLPVSEVPKSVEKILVLINKPSGITITENTTTWDADLKDLQLGSNPDLVGASQDKFFMTNAPLSDGTHDITLLVNVSTYTTEAEAMAHPFTVNVERAVGKVSLSHVDATSTQWTDNSGWEYTLNQAGYVDDKVEFTNWILDNTTKATYAIRHYDKSWESYVGVDGAGGTYAYLQRFRGSNTYNGNNGPEARTYWAKDLTYDTPYDAANFNDNKGAINANMGDVQYCLENTFDVDHMTGEQTTRVLLKATYTPKGFTKDVTWYRVGSSITAKTKDDINTLITTALSKDGLAGGVELLESGIKAGENEIKEAILNNLSTDDGVKGKQIASIKKALGSITAFINGVCYYEVRVQHFGKTYTPWGGETNAPTVDGSTYYDYAGLTSPDTKEAHHYLGRYGIVRNNWYQLELGEIKAPGSPTVPNLSTKADDEQKYYLQATVKIMDWAVRKQSVDL